MDFREKVINDLHNSGVDVTPNNIIDDLFIKKFLEMNEPLNQKIIEFPNKLSFRNFEELSVEDQEKFAGNYFVDIPDGEKSEGTVRLYFDSPTDFQIPEDTTFVTENGLKFDSDRNYEIAATEMSNYTEGMYYYFDIGVIAEEIGNQYNIESEEISECMNPIVTSRIVKVTNPYNFSDGQNIESPEQTYERTKDSISVRNLANDPSINSILKNNFTNSIINLFNVRTGHELMYRDIEIINQREYRVGNKHDVWIETGDVKEYKTNISKGADPKVNLGYSLNELGESIGEKNYDYSCLNLEGEPLDKIIVKVLKVKALTVDGVVSEEISGVKFIQEPFLENSVRQQGYLDFTGTTYENTVSDIQVDFLASTSLTNIQKFVNDTKNRMPVGDALIKHFEILPLYGIIYYKGTPEEIDIQEALNKYIINYHYNEERAEIEFSEGMPIRRILEISDIIDKLYQEGVNKVKMPVELYIDLPNIDLEIPIVINSTYGTPVNLGYEHIIFDSELVTDGTVEFERYRDYTMDYKNGIIELVQGGMMAENTDYDVTFKYLNPEGIGSENNYFSVNDEHKILPYRTLLPKISIAKEE